LLEVWRVLPIYCMSIMCIGTSVECITNRSVDEYDIIIRQRRWPRSYPSPSLDQGSACNAYSRGTRYLRVFIRILRDIIAHNVRSENAIVPEVSTIQNAMPLDAQLRPDTVKFAEIIQRHTNPASPWGAALQEEDPAESYVAGDNTAVRAVRIILTALSTSVVAVCCHFSRVSWSASASAPASPTFS